MGAATAAKLRVIEGGLGLGVEPRVAVATAPNLIAPAPTDRIATPRRGVAPLRLGLAVVVSLAAHAAIVAWGLQHRIDDEARAAGGSENSIVVEGASVVLLDSLPSDYSDGAKNLPEAKLATIADLDPSRAPTEVAQATPVAEASLRTSDATPAERVADDAPSGALPDEIAATEPAATRLPVEPASIAPVTEVSAALAISQSHAAAAAPDTAAPVVDMPARAAIAADTPVKVAVSEAPISPDSADPTVAVTRTPSAIQASEDAEKPPVVATDIQPREVQDSTVAATPDAQPVQDETASRPVTDTVAKAATETRTALAETQVEPEKPKPAKPAAAKLTPEKPAPRSDQRAASVAEAAARGRSAGTGGADGASAEERGRADTSRYEAKLAAHLRRFRTFPEDARKRGITGTAMVRFTVNASGAVSGARLSRSSGEAVLDQAAVAMVNRASPFPPIPGDVGLKSLTVNVPVRFDLR
jgi:protein TonB